MTSPTPYVIVAGGYDTKNVGDYAMLDLFSAAARRRGFETRVLVRHPDEILRRRYGAARLIENFEYESREQSLGRFFRGFNAGDSTAHLISLRRELEGAAGLYIGGGRLLIDHTLDVMRGPLAYFSTLVTLARFLEVPVHLFAMTIVPNRTEEGAKHLRFIVDGCDSVTVRDPESAAHLRVIGCRQSEITVLPDPAFALRWPRTGLRNGRVALSVRHIHPGWGGMAAETYLDRMAQVVESLQATGRSVVGIPHQFYGIDDPSFDDRTILARIAERTPFEFIDEEWLDLDLYRDFYRSVDALVGIRRHSFLFAAAAGVPILAFSENPNASRACRDFDGLAPIALDFSAKDLERGITRVLEDGPEVAARQDRAFEQQAVGLEGRYGEALFASTSTRQDYSALRARMPQVRPSEACPRAR